MADLPETHFVKAVVIAVEMSVFPSAMPPYERILQRVDFEDRGVEAP